MSEDGETTLQLPGVRLHVAWSAAREGRSEQPALVFLHLFGGSSRTWRPVLTELRGEFACVALDLRGFGDSEAPAAGGFSVETMAADVAGVIRELGLRRYLLVGHSMGGKVALALAASAHRPPGLAALVLLAPSPPTPEPMPDAERARLLAGHGSRDAARETLIKNAAHPLPRELYQIAADDLLRASPAAWRAWLEHGSREDISGRLDALQTPVFLAAGAEDKAITADLLRREIVERVPRARLSEVAGARHLLPLEAPREVAGLIRRAVGETGEPARTP